MMDNLLDFIPLGFRAVAFVIAAAGLILMTEKINMACDKVYINIVNEHAVKGEDYYE